MRLSDSCVYAKVISNMQHFSQIEFIYLFVCLYKFIYLFLAVLGLHCCARAFSSCGKRGLLFVAVRGLLPAVASRCGPQALGT